MRNLGLQETMAPGRHTRDDSDIGPGRVPRIGEFRGPALMTWNNKLTALVVECVAFCRAMERDFLTLYGVETATARSGRTALELIYSGATFSLIVIDMDMSGMNGVECTRQLRTMGVRSRILGTTPLYREEEERAFLDAGGDQLIEKPFCPSQFVPILRELDELNEQQE